MATSTALISLGTPAEVARRVGYDQVSVTTSGTTQNSGTGVLRGPGNKIVQATIHSPTGAITLPSNAEIGDEIIITNMSANAGAIFPPSGGTLNGETTDSGTTTLAASGSANSTISCIKLTATKWATWGAVVA